MSSSKPLTDPTRLRRAVLLVAGLNLAYFFIEGAIALAIGSVSLLADSVDFFEDFAVNTLIAIALGWSLTWQARAGKASALIILLPALAAVWQIVAKFPDPGAPDALTLFVTAGGAVVVNLICTLILARFRTGAGSLTAAAFLAARNDVLINLAIIVVAGLTAWVGSGWPDLVLGALILVLNLGAAKEVWETAHEESLAAKALAGDLDDD
ncbi:cation transporter [Rothia nasimurium]|uniref:cation transporter n=1 Tax=Rothia nasimurium TaxID=85336 RepID=UPI001F1BBE27|nr:cation transporter [Rothia nasimurium]